MSGEVLLLLKSFASQYIRKLIKKIELNWFKFVQCDHIYDDDR